MAKARGRPLNTAANGAPYGELRGTDERLGRAQRTRPASRAGWEPLDPARQPKNHDSGTSRGAKDAPHGGVWGGARGRPRPRTTTAFHRGAACPDAHSP